MNTATETPAPALSIHPQAPVLWRALGGLEGTRMLLRFQALALPKGMTVTRGYTRTRAANEINAILFDGAKVLTRASKPPRTVTSEDHSALVQYLSWAIEKAEAKLGPLVWEVVED